MNRLFARLRRRASNESGSAGVEFVLALPIIFSIFMASAESGLLMMRLIMLQRATDMTMRDLRLGNFSDPNAQILKKEICDKGVILGDCESRIMVELQPVSSDSWAMPATATQCSDRDESLDPPPFVLGSDKEIMLVRVCLIMDPIFPTTGIGLSLQRDKGGYALIAASAFVNEPQQNTPGT
ncbi:pilus assembly protein [Cereibacter azotoformans]|uniref:TadE-like domain-containing protein n=1 Tax=Cereibacter azotoformans TaxID=43057 RepID=A0A2T5JWJ7_9RHOB|nr:TadE family protein [Cereibacter azotoformans]AXQ92958.1 pilus assembly protein [Cereibacter sphaeroides]MBO4169363.1 pilus assembly protein [Cereibacter azotoformans]PTR14537.1 hypothetical protein C8J28_1168 [Cereibacter azotoformans]UIJ31251.1 pilus assembly protein [Cereibacter azotoformans]